MNTQLTTRAAVTGWHATRVPDRYPVLSGTTQDHLVIQGSLLADTQIPIDSTRPAAGLLMTKR